KRKLSPEELKRTVFIVNDAKTYLNSVNIHFDLVFFASVLHHITAYNEVVDLCAKKSNAVYIALEPFKPNNIARLFRSVDYRLNRLMNPIEIKGNMSLIQKTELPYISPEDIIKTLQKNNYNITVYYKLAGYMNRVLRMFGPKTYFQILAKRT
ncbi:MAG: hypothetical protein KKI14_03035, partial [Nanoarchaeota archaeon]|nr:hypothetical protein [Nanoarchaeota archaeon]